MASASWLPFKNTDSLLQELREEIAQLEQQLAQYESLSPERRFASPDTYKQLIRVRKELLLLLGDE